MPNEGRIRSVAGHQHRGCVFQHVRVLKFLSEPGPAGDRTTPVLAEECLEMNSINSLRLVLSILACS